VVTVLANQYAYGDLEVTCDDGEIIEYRANTGLGDINIVVRGYWK